MISSDLDNYIQNFSEEEPEILKELYRETQLKVLMPHMCSGNIQGHFLRFITKISNSKNILEIGTFTGYATLCFAMSLPEGGMIDTIDMNKELEDFNSKFFIKSNLQHKIKMHIGKALDIIDRLDKTYDIVFIDADKQNYVAYYDKVFDKVKAGGLIIADNILWKGEVVNEIKSKDCEAMHQYNNKIKNDPRVESLIISIRDGLNIARKK